MIKKDDEKFKAFTKNAKRSSDGLKDFKDQVLEDNRFAVGNQWPDDDVEIRKANGQPSTTMNHCHSVLQTLAGAEITNRFEPKFIRRTEEDQGGNDVLNAALRYHRSEAHSRHEDSIAFRDAFTCGVGCTDTFINYDNDPSGVISSVRVPIQGVMWDPSAMLQDLSDRQFDYTGKEFTVEAFIDRFDPEREIVSSLRGESEHFEMPDSHLQDQSRAWAYLPEPQQWFNQKRGEILVVEYNYKKMEEAQTFRLPDGSVDYAFSDEYEFIKQRYLEETGIDIEENPQGTAMVNRFYKDFMAGDYILDTGPTPYRNFTTQFITCFEDPTKEVTEWFGLIRLMRDPQMWTNKFFAQIIHMIGSNSKGGLLYGPGVFKDPDKARQQWAKPGGMIEVNITKPQEHLMHLPASEIPNSTMQMLQYCASLVPELANVNKDILGGQVGDLKRTSGSAVDTILQRSLSGLAQPFDSFKRYRTNIGRLFLDMIREHGDPRQLVRISGDPYARYAPLAMSHMFQSYDVVIDEAPVNTGSVGEQWNALMENGGAEFLITVGGMPVHFLPKLMPGLDQQHRDEWVQNIQMMQQMAQQAPPAV